jgi:hypothetical protein
MHQSGRQYLRRVRDFDVEGVRAGGGENIEPLDGGAGRRRFRRGRSYGATI